MRALFEFAARLLRPRRLQTLSIVGARLLGGGSAVYAADVDGRRIIFAVSPHAICHLASYPVPTPNRSTAVERGTVTAVEGGTAAAARLR